MFEVLGGTQSTTALGVPLLRARRLWKWVLSFILLLFIELLLHVSSNKNITLNKTATALTSPNPQARTDTQHNHTINTENISDQKIRIEAKWGVTCL